MGANKKPILIIGASSGYGLATAKLMHENGYPVISAQRRQSPFKECWSRHLDVNIISDFERVANWIKENVTGLSAIVYCVGIAAPIAAEASKTLSDIERIVTTNSLGLIRAIKHFVPILENGARFISIGSISETKNYYGGAEYCASKAFNASYLRAMRIEYIHQGIQFCNISPGMGDTEFHFHRYDNPAEANKGIRQLQPESVASAVAYLLEQSEGVCIQQLTITPHDQAEHGADVRNIPKM